MANEQLLTLVSLFTPSTILYLFLGTFLGIVVGALPGLTATMAVSLLVSLTYGMKGANAIVILLSVFLGGIYGGSRSAILLNIPGTPSSAAYSFGWMAVEPQRPGDTCRYLGYDMFCIRWSVWTCYACFCYATPGNVRP